ncbi:hypothetical protein Q5H93_06410 [Hymenobacter sp. ASUV-10]|uniref:DNA-directed DNA polymerase family A palm domain-containing protein n=1 Tax=Hymenobacter aranciens TaxID=3063996 RepID=A0ABT9B9L9_9BACT|nr:hypothetical protein [Hymenobacter sp. ASUV-10]MDO7874358.1 hypothetical protein [Hymenobacter sp. ASUV-10]
MRRLLPPGLDLDAHLVAYPPAFRPFRRDALVHLLHLLLAIPAANRKLAAELDARHGFVPLGSVRLQSWLHNYAAYLAYCLATGLLETDHHHAKGLKCSGFRFAAQYRLAPRVGSPGAVVELRDPVLLRSLARQRRQALDVTPAQRERFAYLLRWLDPATCPLRIDAEAALAGLARRYEQRCQAPDRKPAPLGAVESPPRYKNALRQYQSAVASLFRLAERDMHPGFDAQGRLYSALANAGKDLRPYLTMPAYGPLVCLDLSSSQPYLLNLLLQPACYSSPAEVAAGQVTLAGQGGAPYRRLLRLDPTVLALVRGLLPAAGALPPDVVHFREWTSAGIFYQHLRQAFALAVPERPLPPDESGLKRLVLALLYSPAGPGRPGSWRAPYKAAFAALLPTVYAVTEAFKRRDLALLPCLMQAFEAHLMLDVIARRIGEELPQAPLFSIHDALVTSAEHAEAVEAIMRQELHRATGLEPSIKLKSW